jgi:hypothetical protein
MKESIRITRNIGMIVMMISHLKNGAESVISPSLSPHLRFCSSPSSAVLTGEGEWENGRRRMGDEERRMGEGRMGGREN